MKKIFITLSVALFAMFQSSCELERIDYSEIFEENFFLTADDVELNIVSLYANFTVNSGQLVNSSVSCVRGYLELMTDQINYTTMEEGGAWGMALQQSWNKELSGGTGLESNITTAFGNYNILSKTQSVVLKIEAMDGISDDEKTAYIAEVKCLRGWGAVILYEWFGTLPIATDEMIQNPQTSYYIGRATEAEYEEMVVSDLTAAIEGLPDVASQAGRVSKGAARMMLLKFYMLKKDWTNALAIARDLKQMETDGHYALVDNYFDIWGTANEDNSEFILVRSALEYTKMNLTLSRVLPVDFPKYQKKTSYSDGWRLDWDFVDSFEDGDMRIDEIDPDWVLANGNSDSPSDLPSGMIATKYLGDDRYGNLWTERYEDGTFNENVDIDDLYYGAVILKYYSDPLTDKISNGCDLCVYRFADVYLSLAECINETNNGPTTEAIELVNTIRRRAKISDLAASDYASKDAFNDAILRERGFELYFEGHRRTDLIRHGKYVDVMKAKAAKYKLTSYVDDYKTLFPIPTSYITESRGAIEQNPGY